MKNINRIEAAWERRTENERSRMEEEQEDREAIVRLMHGVCRGPFMARKGKNNEQ